MATVHYYRWSLIAVRRYCAHSAHDLHHIQTPFNTDYLAQKEQSAGRSEILCTDE